MEHGLFTVNNFRAPCAVKYVSGKWVMFVGMSMYGCLSMCAGASQWVGCQWREGQWMAQGLSPFLWFNMTPLALRRQQLRMHMPAILFVVGDYSAIKAPVSSSMARLQNYCFPLWLRKLSPGLQSPVKTQVGALHSEREWMGVFSRWLAGP